MRYFLNYIFCIQIVVFLIIGLCRCKNDDDSNSDSGDDAAAIDQGSMIYTAENNNTVAWDNNTASVPTGTWDDDASILISIGPLREWVDIPESVDVLGETVQFSVTSDGVFLSRLTAKRDIEISLFAESIFTNLGNIMVLIHANPGEEDEEKFYVANEDLHIEVIAYGRLAVSFATRETNALFTVVEAESPPEGYTRYIPPPPDPVNLIATPITNSRIDFTWGSGDGSSSAFILTYLAGAESPGTCSEGEIIDAEELGDATSYSLTELTTNTQYSFRLCSVNSREPPDISAGLTKSSTTPNDPPGAFSLTGPINEIGNRFWDSNGGDDPLTVTWSASSQSTGYLLNVSQNPDCSDPVQSYQIAAGTLSKLLAPLTKFTWHYICLSAIGSGNQTTPATNTAHPVTMDRGWIQVDCSGGSCCAITNWREGYCWGRNGFGLGISNSTAAKFSPTWVNSENLIDKRWKVLRVGVGDTLYFHACGVAMDGQGYCWGRDNLGQLGDDVALVDIYKPTPIASAEAMQDIGTGSNFSCALTETGNVYCWGADIHVSCEMLGNGALLTAIQPTPGPIDSAKTFDRLSVGPVHSCARAADGLHYCWGDDWNRNLGNGPDTDGSFAASPVQVHTSTVGGSGLFTALDAGWINSCAIEPDAAKLYCWGDWAQKKLGNSAYTTDQNLPVPVDVSGLAQAQQEFRLVDSNGEFASCAINSLDDLYCWGSDGDNVGALGDGSTTANLVPGLVTTTNMSDPKALTMSLGVNHGCVVAKDGSMYCWGTDGFGALGRNVGSGSSNIPVAVVNPW